MTKLGERGGETDDGEVDFLATGVTGSDWVFVANIVGGTAALGSVGTTGGVAYVADATLGLCRSVTALAKLSGLIASKLPTSGKYMSIGMELTAGGWGAAATVSVTPGVEKATQAEAEGAPAAGTGKFRIRDVVVKNTAGVYSIVNQFDRRTLAGPLGGGEWGDGSDGSITLDGTAEYAAFMTRAGSVYTLTRDVYAAQLTVNSGVTLKVAGFKVFSTGPVVNNGTIHNDGEPGVGGQEPGSGSAAGGAGALGSSGKGGLTRAGGKGGASGAAEVNGTAGENTGTSNSYGGAGGKGGGSNSGKTGGGGGTAVAPTYKKRTPAYWLGENAEIGAGGGGGGGGGSGLGAGASGGGGGGVLVICARYVENKGTIRANGGSGADSGTDNGGAGGGGGGGAVVLITGNIVAGTVEAKGGAGQGHTVEWAQKSENGADGTVIRMVAGL